MTVYYFNNNINILNIKPYHESGLWIFIYNQNITNIIIKNNNYFNIKKLKSIFNCYFRILGTIITKFEDKCIIVRYLEYEFKLYIYPFDYDRTIRNLKFECAKYSISEKIEKHLILFIDENWDLIIGFIEDYNETDNNCLEKDKIISKSHEVAIK